MSQPLPSGLPPTTRCLSCSRLVLSCQGTAHSCAAPSPLNRDDFPTSTSAEFGWCCIWDTWYQPCGGTGSLERR